MTNTKALFRVISTCSVTASLALSAPAFAQNTTPAAPAPVKEIKEKAKDAVKEIKQEAKDTLKAAVNAKVGEKAPDFSLFDTEGKEHKLSSLAGKVVVLEWFNPDCPFVKKHHEKNKTFADLYTKYSAKDVVFLAINSGAAGNQGAGKERNAEAIKSYGIKYPVLLDESGEVGMTYGSKNTPTMYVIGKDGKLAYKGAIDDDTSGETPGKTNYVAKALDEILAGKPVTTSETKAYGCSVKYGAK